MSAATITPRAVDIAGLRREPLPDTMHKVEPNEQPAVVSSSVSGSGSQTDGVETGAAETSDSGGISPTAKWPPCKAAFAYRKAKAQDRHAALCVEVGGERLQLGMLADGHGGSDAAEYCKTAIFDAFVAAAAADPSEASLKRAAVTAFLSVHRSLSSRPNSVDGCSATLVAVNESRCFILCANVGDSQAMIAKWQRSKASAPLLMITRDHRLAHNPEELARVKEADGHVAQATSALGKPYGPIRAWPGGVTCARALGDADCGAWLMAEPHVSVTNFEPDAQACALLCSAGVWDAIEPATVAALARHAHNFQSVPAAIVEKAVNGRHAYYSSEWNLPRDDTTCVAIHVGQERYAGFCGGG